MTVPSDSSDWCGPVVQKILLKKINSAEDHLKQLKCMEIQLLWYSINK